MLDDGAVLPVEAVKADAGQPLTIGVRPESFQRDADGPLAMEVEVVEPTGPEIHVFGHIGETDVRTVFRDRDMPRSGDTIRLAVDKADIHVFDRQSGARL